MLPNCPTFNDTFWKNTNPSLNTNKQGALQLNDNIKRFGLTQTNTAIHNTDTLNLVNWTLTTAHSAIHKSTVNYRTKQIDTSPQEFFTTLVKAHISFTYKSFKLKQSEEIFTSTWCIGSALASLTNNKLAFHL